MARIMITCPVTKKPVWTGMEGDKQSLDPTVNDIGDNSITCPQCGQEHTWQQRDAYLEGEPPPASA